MANLPTNIVVGQTGHATLHNNTNAQVNLITDGVVVLLPSAGAIGAPALVFALDPDTGIWQSIPNEIVFSIGGVAVVKFGFGTVERRLTLGDGTNAAQLFFDGAAGAVRDFAFLSGGSLRATFRLDSTAESGSNAGSNFNLRLFNDAGTILFASALTVERSTGNFGIGIGAIALPARLAVVGGADIVQLLVRGNGTQTNPIFRIADSASVSLFEVSAIGKITVPTTITAPGTTGNRTINKLAGRVNIAAAGTTVTVTNSLVTANSVIVATIATNDATARVANVVAAAGSFVINIVACTAEVAINWIVIA